MTVQNKTTIKSYFETGDVPTQAQFADLTDSYMNAGSVSAASNGTLYAVSGNVNTVVGPTGYILTSNGPSAAPSFEPAAGGSGGTVTSAGLTMPSIFSVAGSPITVGGQFIVTLSAQSSAMVFASPASADGTPTFRSIVASDFSSQTEKLVLASPVSAAGKPVFRALVASDLPAVSSGSFTLLSTQTATNSATLDFASVITAAYDEYVFLVKDVRPATDGVIFEMRTSSNNGSSYDAAGGDYLWAIINDIDLRGGSTNASTYGNLGSSATFIRLCGAVIDNATSSAVTGELKLYSANSAVRNKYVQGTLSYDDNGTPSQVSVEVRGLRLSATAVNAVRFLMSSGNITSGTIYCYGIKNT